MSIDVTEAYTELQEMCSHVQQPRFEAQNSLDEAKEVNVKQQAEDEKTVVSMAPLRKSPNKGVSYHSKTPSGSKNPPTMPPLCPGKSPNSANKRKHATKSSARLPIPTSLHMPINSPSHKMIPRTCTTP